MRKIVKKIRSWCDNWLAKDETNSQYIGVMNELNATRGAIQTAIDAGVENAVSQIGARIDKEMSAYWVSNGPLLVQQVAEALSSRINDGVMATRDILDVRNDTIKDFIASREATLNHTMSDLLRLNGDNDMRSMGYHQQLMHVFDRVENKTMKRMNVVVRCLEEQTRQASIHDLSNSERQLALLERIRQLEHNMVQQFYKSDRGLNDVYEALQGEIGSVEKAVGELAKLIGTRTKPATTKPANSGAAPGLEWVIDNMDGIIDLARIMDAIRNNDAPREMTIYKAISAIRALELYSAMDVRDELQGWIARCDNDQSPRICMAA